MKLVGRWSLLVLVLAGVVFYGARPSSAQGVIAPPPVVAPPTGPVVGPPVPSPPVDGGWEVSDPVICLWFPSICDDTPSPATSPGTIPNSPANPTAPGYAPSASYPDFNSRATAAGFNLLRTGPVVDPGIIGVFPTTDPAATDNWAVGFATVLTVSPTSPPPAGRHEVARLLSADVEASPYLVLSVSVDATGKLTGIYYGTYLAPEINYIPVTNVPAGQGIIVYGIAWGAKNSSSCPINSGVQVGATSLGMSFFEALNANPDCSRFGDDFGHGSGWSLDSPVGSAFADIYGFNSRDGWGWINSVTGLDVGWGGTDVVIPWDPPTVTTVPAPETTPTTVAPPTCAGYGDCHVTEYDPTPEGETTDETLASRIGGFFDDLLSGLRGLFDWLGQVLLNIALWFWSMLKQLIEWLLAQLLLAFQYLGGLLGMMLDVLVRWLSWIWDAIMSIGAGIVAAISTWIQWLLNGISLLFEWLLDGIEGLLQWLLDGITLLFEWLLQGLINIFLYLFVPDVGLDVLLAPVVVETPLEPWVTEATETVDVITTAADPGLEACGPSFDVPEPIDWTVNAPTPSSSGCPGNGPFGSRLPEDDAAGDVWGWRVPVRAFIAVFMVLGFIFRVLGVMPWAGRDNVEPDAEGALAA